MVRTGGARWWLAWWIDVKKKTGTVDHFMQKTYWYLQAEGLAGCEAFALAFWIYCHPAAPRWEEPSSKMNLLPSRGCAMGGWLPDSCRVCRRTPYSKNLSRNFPKTYPTPLQIFKSCFRTIPKTPPQKCPKSTSLNQNFHIICFIIYYIFHSWNIPYLVSIYRRQPQVVNKLAWWFFAPKWFI